METSFEEGWGTIIHRRICPNCGSSELITDEKSGEIFCTKCGFVISRLYDRGQEWRDFGDEESEGRDRAGSPLTPLVHDLGLSTSIEFGTKSGAGKGMTSKEISRAQRLRVWQERGRASTANERNLIVAMRYITHLADQLNLGKNIIVRAARIYRQALDMA